jgi:hypothetical protein
VYQAMGIEKNKRSFSVPSYGSWKKIKVALV